MYLMSKQGHLDKHVIVTVIIMPLRFQPENEFDVLTAVTMESMVYWVVTPWQTA
jgi:hypothetical protein